MLRKPPLPPGWFRAKERDPEFQWGLGNDTLAARQVLMLLGASEDGRGVAIQEAADVASSHTTTRWGRRLASGFLQLMRRERGERVRVAASAALSLKQPSHVLSLRCCTRVHHSQRRSDDELFAVGC